MRSHFDFTSFEIVQEPNVKYLGDAIGSDSDGEIVVTATRKPQPVKRAMFVMLGNLNPQSSLSEKFKQTLLDKCTVKFRHASSGEEIGKCPGPTFD